MSAPAAHQLRRGLAVARLRHGADDARPVDLIDEIVAQHAARVRQVGIQQQARALQRARRQHHHARLHRHLAPRQPIDKVRFVHQAGVLVHAQLAHHDVGNRSQLAGRERIRQQQIDRARQAIHAQRAARLADRNAHLLAGRDEALHASATMANCPARNCRRDTAAARPRVRARGKSPSTRE